MFAASPGEAAFVVRNAVGPIKIYREFLLLRLVILARLFLAGRRTGR